MSDEFLKIAKKELKEDIDSISAILKKCENDTDVAKNADDIEKHLHKIKGLAPMMNQEEIGEISASLDNILKRIIESGSMKNSYNIIIKSIVAFTQILENDNSNIDELRNLISKL